MEIHRIANAFCHVVRRLEVTMVPEPHFEMACRNAYATVLDRLQDGPPPGPRPGFRHVELDQWIRGDVGLYISCIHDAEEDFADLGPDEQAWFLAIGNEVLYGPERNDEFLREIITELESSET